MLQNLVFITQSRVFTYKILFIVDKFSYSLVLLIVLGDTIHLIKSWSCCTDSCLFRLLDNFNFFRLNGVVLNFFWLVLVIFYLILALGVLLSHFRAWCIIVIVLSIIFLLILIFFLYLFLGWLLHTLLHTIFSLILLI